MAHQVQHRLFGRVTAHHEIDFGSADQFLVKISSRKATEHHRHIGVILFAQPGDLDGPVSVGHPVQVNTKSRWPELPDQLFRIKAVAV
jgi:hypothetical protein